jgi:hypothetical protein
MREVDIFTRNRAKPPKWLDEAQSQLNKAMTDLADERAHVAWCAVDMLANMPAVYVKPHRVALIEMREHIERMLEETR